MLTRATLLALLALTLPAVPAAAATVHLDRGHADVGARLASGRLQIQIKDATGSDGVRWREPRNVVVHVASRARERLAGERALAFLGRAGSSVWVIPQVERRGIVWLGWNTEQLSRSRVRGPVRWSLLSVRGPGRFGLFQTGSFGEIDVLLGGGARRLSVPLGTHAHGSWAFTRRGTYRLRLRMEARDPAGRPLADTETLRIRVR